MDTKSEKEDVEQVDEFEEPTPPALPPRPKKLQTLETLAERSVSPAGSLRVPKASTRPQLQSKATTTLSRADIHTQAYGETVGQPPTLGSRAASTVRSMSYFGRYASHNENEAGDNASIRSVRTHAATSEVAEDVQSLVDDFWPTGKDTAAKDTGMQHQEDQLFDNTQQEDIQFESLYKHEFDDLEGLYADGSNEGQCS